MGVRLVELTTPALDAIAVSLEFNGIGVDSSAKCCCNSSNGSEQPAVKKDAPSPSQPIRREFLKTTGSLALTSQLVPICLSASAEDSLKSKEIFRNKAVKSGTANVVTILHTADIDGQLFAHDEFFIENIFDRCLRAGWRSQQHPLQIGKCNES